MSLKILHLFSVLAEQLRGINSFNAGLEEFLLPVRSPNDPVLKAMLNVPPNLREGPLILSPLTLDTCRKSWHWT